ncbi:MAG: filamentous hemagglutinin N-terminal domain-containing protein, partial [Pseudomonadota bacterium]
MISGEFRAISRQGSQIERLRSRLLGRTALCGVISLGAVLGSGPRDAKAGPQGTVVTHGQISSTTTGNHTQFTQTTNLGIMNHQSMNIGAAESVHFQQPGKSSLTVNRIVGPGATDIRGSLSATGNVWVLNPSGVAISNTAQINVNGLIATTARITDESIISGHGSGSYSFAEAPDGSSIINAGTISAGDGNVVLVAPVVENSGTITTEGSDVAVGAGSGFTVDMDLDGLTRFEVQPGNGVNLTNSGQISAQGGAVYMSANAASSVESAVVSIGGEVEATRIENRGGTIVISGGENGVTEVTGKIDASQVEGAGGKIAITGDIVDIQSTAVVNASGATDGGKVEIGGGFQGRAVESSVVRHVSASAPEGAPLPVAKRTVIRPDAKILANAGTTGNGGEIIVWSDELAFFHGAIEARGGSISGNGGFAEVSGKIGLEFFGSVDLTAPNGEVGGLLLDPLNINVVDSVTGNATDELELDGDIIEFAERDGDTLNIGSDAIVAVGGNVTLQATNDVTISDALALGANDFIVQASEDIAVNDAITSSGTISLTADADSSGSGATGAEASDDSGVVTFGATGSIAGGGTVVISSGANSGGSAADTTLGSITAASLSVTTTGNGNVSQNSGTTITVTGNTTVSAGTGNVTVAETTNDFQGEIDITGQNVDIRDANSLNLDEITATGTLTVVASGAGDVLDAGSNISVTGNTSISAGNDININTNSVHQFGGTVALTADQIIEFNATGNTTFAAISATNATDVTNTLTVNTGTVDFSDTVSIGATSDLTLRIGEVATQSGGTITADALTINQFATSDITLNQANDVNSLQTDATAGTNLAFTDVDEVSLGIINTGTLSVAATQADLIGAVSATTSATITNANTSFMTVGGAGDADGTTFDLTQTSLDNLTTGNLILNPNDVLNFDAVDTTTTTNIDGVMVSNTGNAVNFLTGANSFEALTISDAAAIADTGTVSVTGATAISSTSTIALDNTGNDFVGAVSLTSSSDVDISDTNGITLAGVSAASLDVVSGGNIVDDGVSVSVADDVSVSGLTSLSATGDVVLDDTFHDFDEVDISATTASSTIVVADSDDITLGDIDAGGTFSVSATTIADDGVSAAAGDDVNVTNGTTLTASTGDITLDDGNNDFGGDIVIAGSSTGTTATIVSNVDEQINFGAVTAANLAITTPSAIAGPDTGVDFNGTVALNSGAGTLTLNSSGESIVLGGTVAGTLNLSATDIGNLDNGVGTLIANSSGGSIIANAAPAALNQLTLDATLAGASNDGQISVGPFTATNLSATGNDIIEASGTAGATVSGLAALTATGESAAADGDITLNNNGGTGFDFGTVSATATDAIDLGDENAISLAGIDGASLSVNANGAIEDDGTSTATADDVSISGTTTLTAGGDIILDDDFNEFSTVIATANSGTSAFELDEATGVTLGNISATTVSIDAGGTIDQVSSTSIVASDTVDITATDSVTLNESNNNFQSVIDIDTTADAIVLVNSNDVTLGGVDGSSLSISATGGILDDAVSGAADDVSITGTTTLTSSGGAIILDDDNHDLATVVATANSGTAAFELDESTGVTLGNIAATTVSIDAGGTIDQVSSTSIVASDTVDITATDSVTLNESGNNLQSVIDIDTTADAIVLVNSNAVTLGGVDGSSLSVSATGVIADDAVSASVADDVSISGDTTLTAGGDIILDDDFHDFSTVIANANSGTSAFALDETTGVTLGNIAATTVSIDAGGAIDQVVSTSIVASDTVDITATDSVTLNQPDNDFQSVIDIDTTADAIVLVDTNAITLGGIDGSSFSLSAGGTVIDDGVSGTADDVVISGASTLNAAGDLILDDTAHDFDGSFNASAQDIVLADVDAVELGNVTATAGADTTSDALALPTVAGNDGDLFVTVGTSITQTTTTVISVPSVADFNANTASGNTITVDQANLFEGLVDADGFDITLGDANSIELRDINAFGFLSVAAQDGSVTDTGTSSSTAGGIDVAGLTTLTATSVTADNDITLDDVGNDFDDDAAGPDAVDGVNASGNDVSIFDEDALALGVVTADTLTVTARGSITDTSAQAIAVTGATTITAVDAAGTDFFDIQLDNVDTHNFDSDAGAAADATAGVFLAGEDIHIDDVDAILLATVTTNADTADATIANGDGDLTVLSGGSITDSTQTITVVGDTSMNATNTFDILIANAGGSSTFTGVFSANGEQIQIRQSGNLTVGAVTANGGTNDATINNNSGAGGDATVFLTEGGEVLAVIDLDLQNFVRDATFALNAPGILITQSSPVTFDSSFLSGITASTALAVRTTGVNDITVDTVDVSGIPTVSFFTSSLGGGVTGNDAGGNIAFNTGASTFANLRAVSGGNITQNAGLTVTGTAFFLAADSTVGNTAQTITLDNAGNDFQSTVDAVASGAIALRDTDGIEFGLVSAGFNETDTVDTTRTLTVTSGGTITQQAAGASGRPVFVRGDLDGTGTLGVDLEGARVEVADAATLTASSTIDLDQGADILNADAVDNDFDRLTSGSPDAVDALVISASGQSVTIVDENALALGSVTAATLNVGAGGSITDTSGQSVSITGTTSIVAFDDQGDADATNDEFFDIALDNVDTHDFDADGSGDAFNAVGEDITVDDATAIVLGAVST